MDEAIKNRNGVGFFHAARQAVTERLAERWSVPASRVTPAEIQARLSGNGEKICALYQTRRRGGLQPRRSHRQRTCSMARQHRATTCPPLIYEFRFIPETAIRA